MERAFVLAGAVFALTAVGLGAFGAHGLRGRVSAEDLATFETGARYQMYHAFALIAVAWIRTRWPGASVTVAGFLFIAGTLVFSGTLYLLVLSGKRWLGAVTPLGGLTLLVAWALVVWRTLRG